MTGKDVAIEADVSISAVSRTFTEGASVSARTREKVLKAAEKLGYRPNVLARSLMTRRSHLVGLISANFRNPAFMEIFDRFTLLLQQRKLRPIIFNLSGEMDFQEAIDLLIDYRVDGVIIASSTISEAFANACLEARLPTVLAFGRSSNPGAISAVIADNVRGGEIAADLVRERGYRRIGFIGGPEYASTTIDRLKGFRRRLKRLGVAKIHVVNGTDYTHADGFAAAAELFADAPDTEIVFCGDDILAMGASDFIRSKLGRRIPEDIGVLGFNDISMARWPAYDLTTIRQPIDLMISNAIDLVCARIDEPAMSVQTRLIPCQAVVRGTLREPVPKV